VVRGKTKLPPVPAVFRRTFYEKKPMRAQERISQKRLGLHFMEPTCALGFSLICLFYGIKPFEKLCAARVFRTECLNQVMDSQTQRFNLTVLQTGLCSTGKDGEQRTARKKETSVPVFPSVFSGCSAKTAQVRSSL
jgi:hypothetical protein